MDVFLNIMKEKNPKVHTFVFENENLSIFSLQVPLSTLEESLSQLAGGDKSKRPSVRRLFEHKLYLWEPSGGKVTLLVRGNFAEEVSKLSDTSAFCIFIIRTEVGSVFGPIFEKANYIDRRSLRISPHIQSRYREVDAVNYARLQQFRFVQWLYNRRNSNIAVIVDQTAPSTEYVLKIVNHTNHQITEYPQEADVLKKMKGLDGKIIKILENFRLEALGLEFFRFEKYLCSGYEVAQQVEMSEVRAVGYLRDCLEGLLVLQGQGYAHTDLKPSNILITLDASEAHICDLEHLQEIGSKNLRKHFGTFHYNPPERAYAKILLENNKADLKRHSNPKYKTDLKLEVTPQLDMWSLGLTFLEILTKRHPFESYTEPTELLAAQAGWSLESWLASLTLPFALSGPTVDLAKCMLAFYPAERPDYREALEHHALALTSPRERRRKRA